MRKYSRGSQFNPWGSKWRGFKARPIGIKRKKGYKKLTYGIRSKRNFWQGKRTKRRYYGKFNRNT